MAFPDGIRWDLGEDIPYEDLVELIGEESEDDNGASVVPAEDASIRQQINEVQDMLDFDREAEIDNAIFGNDEAEEEEEPVADENKEAFQDTEFAVLASGEDTEDVEIESARLPADDEYEEDEDENGIVVIKKRSDLGSGANFEETLPVLSEAVARHYARKINIIIVRTYKNTDVKHTTRDKDIPGEIVRCTTHDEIDTSASYAFVLGDQTDSLEEVAERLSQEKTIKDGEESWIPIGDVYRHPTTHNIEVRAMPEDQLGKLAEAMNMSIEEVLEKVADQVGKYRR